MTDPDDDLDKFDGLPGMRYTGHRSTDYIDFSPLQGNINLRYLTFLFYFFNEKHEFASTHSVLRPLYCKNGKLVRGPQPIVDKDF